jgi:hypothetical protein
MARRPTCGLVICSVEVPAAKRGTPWAEVRRRTRAARAAARAVSAFLDTNVLVRHLTGDPPAQGAKATRALQAGDELLLADLILAELAYVLESFYETPRH